MPEGRTRRELLLCVSGVASVGLAADTPTPIRIANASGGLNLTMAALMREMKYLEAFDLAPELISVADGTKILGGIVGGSVDVSMASGFGQIFPAIEHGAKLKVLGGGALIPTIAMFTGKPYVQSLKDLEGRTIGTGSIGALVHQLVVVLLSKYKVDVTKVRFVNIGSSADVFRAVSEGTVDAGPAEAALIDGSGRYKVRPIPHGNMSVELKEYTYQGAWTSDEQIARNRDVLVRALAAYAKLYRFTQTPKARESFIQARRSVFPTAPQSDHEAQWNYVQTYKPFAEDLVLAPERLRYMQELSISFGAQKTVLPFNRVADMSLAADAVKLLR
jgi:ABC-type nitrate/sulfonate/bicarbonate transport system substrate-binding protein